LLGILNIFNIFNFGDQFSEDFVVSNADAESSLTTDTRTGIFKDALMAIDERNAYVWGISAAGLYKTQLEDVSDEFFEELKLGRMGNEVGILEYLLRGGLIYVVLVFLLYYHASRLAIWRSNNLFCKSMGLFVAFRWLFLFIESQPTLTLANLVEFLVIGICLSPAFRQMSDYEMKVFIRQSVRLKDRRPRLVMKRKILLAD
jgi:O-antigen ligase